MAGHKSINLLREKIGPARVAKAKAQAQTLMSEMLLSELRKLGGVTQVELAKKLGVKQPAVSQLEKQDDMQISTLQRIVEALGGDLEITVRMRGGEYKVKQFEGVVSNQ